MLLHRSIKQRSISMPNSFEIFRDFRSLRMVFLRIAEQTEEAKSSTAGAEAVPEPEALDWHVRLVDFADQLGVQWKLQLLQA